MTAVANHRPLLSCMARHCFRRIKIGKDPRGARRFSRGLMCDFFYFTFAAAGDTTYCGYAINNQTGAGPRRWDLRPSGEREPCVHVFQTPYRVNLLNFYVWTLNRLRQTAHSSTASCPLAVPTPKNKSVSTSRKGSRKKSQRMHTPYTSTSTVVELQLPACYRGCRT